MTAKVIRFPSRVTGAMRLPDPLDYPNEGEIYTAEIVQLPAVRRLTPFELWLAFSLAFAAACFFAWHR